MAHGWTSFAAIGDSFTEGVGDPRPDGTFRGWADLVAAGLAQAQPGFRYANLAVRGRKFGQVVAEQLPVAVRMEADLVSFAAGGNDALRPRFDTQALIDRMDRVVGQLRTSGADVVLFMFPDMSVRLPLPGVLKPRIVAMNQAYTEVAARHDAHLVDLFADAALHDPRLWSDDRLHLNAAGHRRVADHVLATLGVTDRPAPAGSTQLHPRWPARRAADLRWAGAHLGPWLHRHARGRSSGDGIRAKRPELSASGFGTG
ncbi:SGNH/GDSL hydrolase family protein [Spirillospora sp. NPDC048911]|uniref:SGNH/GDSL hydrolase family protein n=1 Tax=Spirillospora sp. NPDC048911 TaxID=3364527 RepID=UPI003715B77F